MPLLFIGIDPKSGDGESPTVWADTDHGELVFQGWKPSPELEAACAANDVPGHSVGIPENEQLVRIPARMIPDLRKAIDALEAAGPELP